MSSKNLPPIVVRATDLKSVVGIGSSTAYALMRQNKFPKSFTLVEGDRPCIGWLFSDLQKWAEERKQASQDAK